MTVAIAAAACLGAAAPPVHASAVASAPPAGTLSLERFATHARDGALQQRLAAAPAWRSFRARHGAWWAEWNERTGTPHRAIGPSFALAGFAPDSAGVDRAVRGFVAAESALLGAPDLEARAIRHHGRAWYASYRERVNGMPVLFADWEFRVSDGGRLMLFGADAYGASRVPAKNGADAVLAPAAAVAAAAAGIDYVPGVDAARVFPARYWLPDAAGEAGGSPVRLVTITLARPPFSSWLALVDATSGALVARVDRTRGVTGRVTALVHGRFPTDVLHAVGLPRLVVRAGADSAVTDANGYYVLPRVAPDTLTFGLQGLFAAVDRYDAVPTPIATAYDTVLAAPDARVDVAWGDDGYSHDAERDAYVAAEIAHGDLETDDPGFTGLDYPYPVHVNVPYTHCNSVYNGTSLYFFSAGDGCVNAVTSRQLLFHEYGHAINDGIYVAEGVEEGLLNGAMHEGLADVNATYDEDDPHFGEGFYGAGTYIRSVANTHRYPEDLIGEFHTDGMILSGAFWDLREAIGHPAAARLVMQARHGHPDDPDDGVAFHEMFDEVLVADDDDGDLSNGTPHMAQIVAAFGAHGIGPNFDLAIEHAPIADPAAGDSIAVTARITYSGPSFSALDAASPTLHVAIDRGPFTTRPLRPTGAADTYGTLLVAPAGSVVSYYLTARDRFGTETSLPVSAPAGRVYRFLVGPARTVELWDMETDPGWVVGAPGDAATTGIWIRCDPNGTALSDGTLSVPIQPEDDHTPNGTQCWVTGNAPPDYVITAQDIDGGRTTLTSTAFDPFAGGVEHPVVEYWRWYSNNAGSFVGGDAWRTYVSADSGATWVPVEDDSITANEWQRVLFRIEDYVVPSHLMKLRFVANDDSPPSVVEAALDDVRLLGFAPGVVAAPALAVFDAPRPNPSAGAMTLSFTTTGAARARLDVYDLAGRRVRKLLDGLVTGGAHDVTWDGRDGDGRLVPGGVYFARLDTGGRQTVRKLLRVR